jgi:flagellar basal-body rod modification protein FlgD
MAINATSFTPFTTFGATPSIGQASASANSMGATANASSSDGVDTVSSNGSTSMYGLTTDDFLKLFLAQLQNQDPTQPVDDSQMLNQLSQMSQIQTMQQIQTALEGSQLAQSSSLIGKNVTGIDVNGSPVDGIVTAVTQSNDAGLVLQVGSQYIKPDSVVNVTAPSTTTASS